MSMNSHPARDLPAISSQGNPPAASICSHTCFRILALACAIRVSVRSEARSRTRRTVDADGAGRARPQLPQDRYVAIAVAPSAMAIAVETSTIPRLSSGDALFSVSAPSRAAVRPALVGELAQQDPAAMADQAVPAGSDLQGMIPGHILHREERSSSRAYVAW